MKVWLIYIHKKKSRLHFGESFCFNDLTFKYLTSDRSLRQRFNICKYETVFVDIFYVKSGHLQL